MKTNHIKSGFFLRIIVISVFSLTCAYGDHQQLAEDMGSVEERTTELIAAFSTTGDMDSLNECLNLLFPNYKSGDESVDLSHIEERLLVARLKVLNACDRSISELTLTLSAEELSRQLFEETRNTTDKRKIDAAVQRYETAIKQLEHEIRLRKTRDKIVRRISIELERVVNDPNRDVSDDIKTIKKMVKDEETKKSLWSEIGEISELTDSDNQRVEDDQASNNQPSETKEYHKLRPLNSANAGEEIKNTVNTAPLPVVQTSTNRVLPSEGLENSPVPANSSPQFSNPWKLLFPTLGIVVLILAVLFSKHWKSR